ncbi:MBL fold metallo-hydrolase [Chitinophaga rhizophila]|uniref:MBL fold metallo-hydrolase n=1 Tax=Chitinophaga rhizophila TaxID=2866212 RepID=A0ABS7GJK9_9BACT|nr:MBL fold metallo-hydrolase [Chitinophaga rhizophila]MBW8687889.1 MBL fold metallo-hydrolase [Chitinophaga rhizophila]
MNVQLLRNASLVLTVNGKTILVDPFFAPKEAYDAFDFTGNSRRNPLVDLPLGEQQLNELVAATDAVLLTHIHLDHWDAQAIALLSKDIPVFCQPDNEQTIAAQGFTAVTAIIDELTWQGIKISRTGGRHGTGAIGEKMGIVSGYVVNDGTGSVYIAGDTIWCEEVKDALDKYHPEKIIVNGGAARFIQGDPIVMDIPDIIQVCNHAPAAMVYVVHLEAVNHATESRRDILQALIGQQLNDRCLIPEDGAFLF